MTRRIYVTDCEGPLTRNDNAQEIAERFLPDGGEFFVGRRIEARLTGRPSLALLGRGVGGIPG